MNLRVDGAFIYFTIPLFGGIPITQTTVSHLFVTLLLCAGSILLGRNLHKQPGKLQVLTEKGVMLLQELVVQTMGEQNVHWTSFVGTIFLSSLLGSWIGLTGFLRASTADLSCTLVWALTVSAICWYQGIKNAGFVGWLRGFTKPIGIMTPMNIIGQIAQPISMAFRHFGSIAGGGVITTLLYAALSLASAAVLQAITARDSLVSILMLLLGTGLILVWRKKNTRIALPFGIVVLVLGLFGLLQALGILSGVPILALGIPAILSCYFDLFSGFVQAYVFTLLTMVYIADAFPGEQAVH